MSCLCVCLSISARSEVLDRIAVTVGKQVVAESDLVRDLRVVAFLDRKPPDLSPNAKRTSAVRLVDQILMLREASESHLDLAGPDEAVRLLAQEKSKFGNEEEYREALAEYQVTEADLTQQLLAGFRALQFTTLRFRPGIQVSDTEVRTYYDNLAEGWRRAGRSSIPSFDESREQVETLLIDDRTLKALDQWLEMQRESKEIQYREAAFK